MVKFKRFIAIISAISIIVSACAISIANADDTKGTINITNAEMGKKYSIYKIFDATYTTYSSGGKTETAVTYTTKDEDMIKAIKDDLNKPIPTDEKDAGTVCPFTLLGKPDKDGNYTVVYKENFPEKIGRGWIKNYISANEVSPTAEKTCEKGNTVSFTDLELGYYLIQPGDGAIATLNSVAPTINVVDKNPRTPMNPDKTTTEEGGITIGQTVDYSISFTATNFYTSDNGTGNLTKMIDKYTVKDIATGIENMQISSVKYYKSGEDKTDPTKGTEIKPYSDKNPNGYKLESSSKERQIEFTSDITYTVTDNTNLITIPWAALGDDEKMESLYPSPVDVVISYKMTVNEDAVKTSKLTADNKMKVTAYYENTSIPLDEKEISLPTTSLSLR